MKKLQHSFIALAAALSLTSFVPLSPIAFAAATEQMSVLGTDVDDAYMYRGIITEVFESEEVTCVQIAQIKGTNFGSPTLSFNVTNDTKLNFDKSELKEGAYLEVYYTPTKASVLQTESAILVNKLVDAQFSNYNGTVVKITPDKDKKATGDILLKDSTSNSETLFHYSDKTSTYLDLTKVKAGDKLNIYHNGALTRSIPPQGNAVVIRNAADTSLYRGTVTKVSTKKGIATVSLKRAAGTDFAKSTFQIRMNKNTKSDITPSKIKKGMYLEVFFTNSKKTPTALSVDQLFESKAVIYNGNVTEVTPDTEKPGYGSIAMKDLNGGNETIFHYSPSTKFQIALSDLKDGTTVSIYHKGISTMSIPPQCIALEVSAYVK